MDTVRQIKVRLFGEAGADRFDEALTAAHAFAQASNCPPGDDVFRWLERKNEELIRYEYDRLRAAATQEAGRG